MKKKSRKKKRKVRHPLHRQADGASRCPVSRIAPFFFLLADALHQLSRVREMGWSWIVEQRKMGCLMWRSKAHQEPTPMILGHAMGHSNLTLLFSGKVYLNLKPLSRITYVIELSFCLSCLPYLIYICMYIHTTHSTYLNIKWNVIFE